MRQKTVLSNSKACCLPSSLLTKLVNILFTDILLNHERERIHLVRIQHNAIQAA